MARAAILTCIVLTVTVTRAHADRALCAPDANHRGAAVDLDFKDADIHDVLRLLADVGKVNLVVSDQVIGKVTVRLRRVAWDRAACAIAATRSLSLVIDGNILIVTPASPTK